MVDVFISYARGDRELVRRLADAVRREGYEIWWDDELPPHLSYGDVITEKIGAAKAAIVVWSNESAASEWVRAEADVARNQKKLIQTSIDERMPPMPFNQIQFAQIGDWRGEDDHPGWMKVKASLLALCGAASGAPSPVPQRASPVPAPPAAPPPHSRLVPILIGLLFLTILAASYLLWSRGRGETDPNVAGPAAAPAPAPVPPKRAAASEPEPAPEPEAAVSAPAPREGPPRAGMPGPGAKPNRRAVVRYCMGPGRGTPQCRQLRARFGR